MLYIIRPPASASESMSRLLVMNCCMRPWERWVVMEESGVLLDDEVARPPHSGRKTGREVMR